LLAKLLDSLKNKNSTIEELDDFVVDDAIDATIIHIPKESLGEPIPCNGLRTPSNLEFPQLYWGPRGDSLIGLNLDSGQLIKIGLYKHPRKTLSIEGETQVLSSLNQQGCTSCPSFIESGYLDITALGTNQSPLELPKSAPYLVQEYMPTANEMPLPDLILAMIEQKNLGYYHGDLKPANIRFDPDKGTCVLIDYDQAEKLNQQTIQLNAYEYVQWCDIAEQRKYSLPTWRRHFPYLEEQHIDACFYNGAFDLSKTTLYRNQTTTNTANGIYQTIHERDIFADGIRDLHDRIEILDAIEFASGEQVLDIGCNAGLLCHYLHDRGCEVTGVELDPSMVTAAGIISRITHRDIEFICFDLDKDKIYGNYDTIMLFSILHHASNIEESAKKITSSCNRIIIECRSVESGKRPHHGTWQKTSTWDYSDIHGLIQGLEKLFPGFVLTRNYGIGGKNRYILEFIKQTDA
jgi:SAM-dependent methyltransferase